jgi:hypothetical protein
MHNYAFNKKSFLLLWLINPFVSAVLLLKRMGSVPQILPYLLLSFFFGISFVIAPGSAADSGRYSSQLQYLHNNPVGFTDYIGDFYSEDSLNLDLYQPLLTWGVSQFTGNYQWLFGIFALIFGYFWFKSLLMIRQLMPQSAGLFLLLCFLLLALINPIWNINGVRMWTAVQVFFYGLLLLNVKNHKTGYILLFSSIFIHFSLSIALVIYFVFTFFPVKNFAVMYAIYLITFFVGELDLGLIREYFEQLPGFLQSRQGYLNEEYAAGRKEEAEQMASHILLYRKLLQYLIVLFASWIFFNFFFKKKRIFNQFAQLFALALFFSAFSNLASQVPSGGRFMVLSNLLVLTSFIWYLSQNIQNKLPFLLRQLALLSMLFIITVQIRMGFDYIGIFFFVGNPVFNLLVNDTVPVITFIKSLL